MNLLQMSIFGGVIILVVTIIRMFAINHLPKKTFLILWGIVLVRLLVAFSLPSPISVYSFINDAYEIYGISFDENGKMLYNGELVRYFWDGYAIEDYGRGIHYEYINKDGKVDIHTTRNIIDNKDGSVDPFEDLTGIVRYKEKDFEFYHTDAIAVTEAGNENVAESTGRTFAEIFSEYATYGIEYKEEHVGSGNGNVYFNGQLVKQFIDESPNGGVFSYHSKDGGKITIHTIYDDNGTIIGVEKK